MRDSRTYTCEPGTEVSGYVMNATVNNLQSHQFLPLLEKYGIDEIDPEQWYPLEVLLSIFNDMGRRGGEWSNFVALGMGIARSSVMPPSLDGPDLSKMLELWDEHYQINHRNGEITHAYPSKIADQHYQIRLDRDHTYPFDLVYGLVWGTAQIMLPDEVDFEVWYDEAYYPINPDGDRVIIHVKWG